jgi:hypothetical protein
MEELNKLVFDLEYNKDARPEQSFTRFSMIIKKG